MEKDTTTLSQAPEEATTVGMFLKYTRLSQKKSVETVSKVLCIRKIYIKAIEESNFKELPPIPYGVGFVRSYAEYLGLNSDRIVQCYKEEAMPKKNDSETQFIHKHSSLTIPTKKQIIISIISIVLLYLLWLIINYNKTDTSLLVDETEISVSSSPEDILDIENIEEYTAPQENVEMPQINISEDSYVEPSTELSKSRVTIKFKGESWLEIRNKEKVYISGIYKKGFTYDVPNESGLIFSVGRYYNVDVYIDGKLTQVARPRKQTKILLDNFLNH